MKRFINIVWLLFLLATAAGFVRATEYKIDSPNIVAVDFRLYEGFRQDRSGVGDVVSSYYLKSQLTTPTPKDVDIDREKQALKKIFYLKDVKLIHRTGIVLKQNKWENRFQVMVLNDLEFQVQLSRVSEEESDRFKVEVKEMKKDGKSSSLLDTEILMPGEKITSLGFESSAGKMYFLSFNQLKNIPPPPPPPKIPKHPPQPQTPRLIHKVPPQYPREALKARVSGKVVLEVNTDTKGRVIKLKVLTGHPLLATAAIDAVRQWQYEVLHVNGKPTPATFQATVDFHLKK